MTSASPQHATRAAGDEPAHAVSVVIPSYNAQRWIAATLESVLSQAGVQLQVIVVDDGSTDDTVATVRRQFPSVELIVQANAGVAAARNRGIQAARHRWVAFVDADDVWLPGKLQAQLQCMQELPGARLACAPWYVWFSEQPQAPAEWLHTPQTLPLEVAGQGSQGWLYAELLGGCNVWTSTVLAERSLLRELNGFDPGMKVGEDYDLWLRASRVTPIARCARPLALYRQHPQSLTKRLPDTNYEGVVLQTALSRWGLTGPDGSQASRAAVKASLARSWHGFSALHLGKGHLKTCFRGLGQALRADWTHLPAWKLGAKALLSLLGPRPPGHPLAKP